MSDMDTHQSTDEPRFIFLACSWSPVIFLDLSLVKAESLLLASETLISCFPSEWYVNYAFNGLKVFISKSSFICYFANTNCTQTLHFHIPKKLQECSC